MKIRTLALLLYVLVCAAPFAYAKKNSNTKPYPLGNPVITHMYTADAAPHVMPDGRVWMVTSVDHEDGGGYATMHKYHTFSSADMVHWTDHGEILNVWEVLGSDKEPEGEDWALWAPDMVYHQGKYYLYFPVRILHTDQQQSNSNRAVTSYIAAAVSDAPDKRFTVINPKIDGTRGIDPSVFIDDDGEKYLYYGNHWGAKLKDNMIELDGKPIHMDVDDKHFMEAIWMNKRGDTYYVSYHTHYGKPIDPDNPDDPNRGKSRLDYGISDSPLGPFKYAGIMNYELGVNVETGPKLPGKTYVPWRLYQSNHGGIVEYHGAEYLFYHTSALSSWRQDEFKGPGTWTQRSVCVDKLNYNSDGTIIPVQQTVEGVDPVKIDQPFAIDLDPKKAELTGSAKVAKDRISLSDGGTLCFENVDLGTGYYYFGVQVEKTIPKAKLQIRLDSADGLLLGTIVLNENSVDINNGTAETFLRGANGKHNVYLLLNTEKNRAAEFTNPRFFAGAPKTPH